MFLSILLLTLALATTTLLAAVPAAMAASPAQDGTAAGICSTSATTCTTGTLTTTGTSDVLYLTAVVASSTSGSSPTVSGVTSTPSLTWTHRQSIALPATTTGYCSSTRKCDLEAWYTTDTNTFSGTVTVTATAAARMSIVVFGISGANTANPFDPDVSTACTGTATSGEPSCNLSTGNADDFVIGGAAWLEATTGGTAGPGFTLIATTSTGRHVNSLAEHDIVSSAQSNLEVSIGSPACSTTVVCGIIGDAVTSATTTTVTCSPNPIDDGVTTTCTAFTSPSAVGKMTFSGFGSGTVTGSPCTLSSGSCSATYTPASGASSPQTITAAYAYGGSGSASLTIHPTLSVPAPAVTHNPVDVGQSVTFTASPTGGSGTYNTYSWTGLPTGCTASNSATITCSPSTSAGSPFSVGVAVTDSTGNTVTSSALSLTVDSALSAGTLSATHNPVDLSEATTVSTSGAAGGSRTYTYSWTGLPSGCSSSNSASIICEPTSNSGSPYTLTLTVTDGNSNTATATLSLTVDPSLSVPTPTVTHNPADVGQSVTFTASPTGGSGTYSTYSWTGLPTGCTASNSATVTCSPSMTSGSPFPVEVAVTDSNGNTITSNALSFTVDSALSAGTLSASHNPVDINQATTISSGGASGGSGTYAYSWSGLPSGCSSSDSASVSCTPSSVAGTPFTVTLTVADGNSNTATATLSLTVDSVMTAATSATHNPVDVGQATTISASASGGSGTYTSYLWSGLPPGCSGAAASFICTPTSNSASPYTVQVMVTDSNGGAVAKTFSLTVDPVLSAGTLSATHNLVDVGQGTTVSTSSATGGSGAGTYSYSWTDLPSGCSSSNSASIVCTPTATTGSPFTVLLTLTDGNGNTASATLSLTVDSALTVPTPAATHNPADVGEPVAFTASPSGGSGTYSAYAWTGLPAGCTASNSATITCSPSTTTGSPFSVTVAVTDSNGNAVESSPLSFTVGSALSAGTLSATQNPVDSSQTTNISTSGASGGTGLYTYTWTNLPSGCSSSNSPSIACTPSSTSGSPFTLTLTVTDSASNTATAALTLTVDPALTAAPSATVNPVDVGQATTVSAEASGGSGTYISYVWSGLPPGCSGSTASFSCTPTSNSGTPYTVLLTVTDSNDNKATRTFALTAHADPTVSVSPAGPFRFDVGQASTELTATITYTGPNTASVEWYGSGSSSCSSSSTDTGTSGPSFTPNTSSAGPTYYCAVVSDSGVTGYSSSSSAVEVTVDPDPTVAASPSTSYFDVGQTSTDALTSTVTYTGPNIVTIEWFASSNSSSCTISGSALASGTLSTLGLTPSTSVAGTVYYCAQVTDSGAGLSMYTSYSGVVSVTVDSNPTVSVAPVGPLSYDVGQSALALTASITYSGPNTVSVEWYGSAAPACSNLSTDTHTSGLSFAPSTHSTGTTYYCAVVSDSGVSGYHSSSSSVEVAVDPALSAGTLSAAHDPVDVNQAMTISTGGASGGTGSGTYSYSWSGLPPGCGGSNSASITCTPASNGGSPFTVALTVVDGNGDTATTTLSLSVDPALTVAPSANLDQVDVGQTTNISAEASGGSGTYTSYVWSGLPSGCSGSTASFDCTPSSSNGNPFTVQVEVTDSNGNTRASTFTLTVDPDPTVSIAPAGPFVYDVGQSAATLTATVTYAGPNTAAVEWYSSASPSCSSSSMETEASGLTFTVSSASAGTTYYCAVVSDSGLPAYSYASNAVEVTVFADPTVSVAPVGPLSYDVGQPAGALTATVTYAGPNTATVEWYSSGTPTCDSLSGDMHTSGASFTPGSASTGTTWYCAVVSDSGVPLYVYGSGAVEVDAYADPTVSVAPTGTLAYDVGQSASVLTATLAYTGPNSVPVEWYSSATPSCSSSSTDTTQSGLSFTPSTSAAGTTYYCAVVSDSGVPGYHSPSDAVEVTFYADPTVGASPSALSYDVGQSSTNALTATVAYTGPNTATVEWFTSSSSSMCTASSSALASGSSATLELTPSASLAGTYYYCAQVTDNGAGLTSYVSYSNVVAVRVFADPTVSVVPGPLLYDVGQTAPGLTASVTYTGPNGAYLSVEWYSSTTATCSTSSTDTSISGTAFTPSTSSKGTSYYCAVVSDSGIPGYATASSAVEVTVYADPTVSVAPTGPLLYDVGQSASALTATVTYTGPNGVGVSVEWYSSTSAPTCNALSGTDTGTSGDSFTPSTSSAGTTYYCAVVSDSAVSGYQSPSTPAVENVVGSSTVTTTTTTTATTTTSTTTTTSSTTASTSTVTTATTTTATPTTTTTTTTTSTTSSTTSHTHTITTSTTSTPATSTVSTVASAPASPPTTLLYEFTAAGVVAIIAVAIGMLASRRKR